MGLNTFSILTTGISSFLNCLLSSLPHLSIGILTLVCLSQRLRAFWKALTGGRDDAFARVECCFLSSCNWPCFLPEKFSSAVKGQSLELLISASRDCYSHRPDTHDFFSPFFAAAFCQNGRGRNLSAPRGSISAAPVPNKGASPQPCIITQATDSCS